MGPDFIVFKTLSEAQTAAQMETIQFPEARLINGSLFKQGGRWMFCATVTMSDLTWFAKTARRSTTVGTPPNKPTNREESKNHTAAIREYLLHGRRDYILGGTTEAIASPIKVFRSDTDYPVVAAYALFKPDVSLFLTDGLHRTAAVAEAIQVKADLAKDGIVIQFVFENDLAKIRQDFADMGTTLPQSESMKQDYNPALPIFAPSARVRKEFHILHDRVDVKAKTLSTKSDLLFTLANFNLALASIVIGRPDLDRNTMVKLLTPEFKDEGVKSLWTERMVRVFRSLVEYNSEWKELSITANPNIIRSRKQEYVSLYQGGLKVICAAAHYIFNLKTSDGKDDVIAQDNALKHLARICYRWDNPIWSQVGMVVQIEGRGRPSFSPKFGPWREAVRPLLANGNLEHLYDEERSARRRGRPRS